MTPLDLRTEISRLQRALRDRLEACVLVLAKPANAAARTAMGHRNEDPRAVDLRLRGVLAAEPLDLPRRPREHRRRQVYVDRGVRHPLLQELTVDDRLAVAQDRVLDPEREVVHQRFDQARLTLERRVHQREALFRDLPPRPTREVLADRAE